MTQQELKTAGYIFHPGYVSDHGDFVFTAQQTTANLSDLIVSEYQLVPGGIMEPPKPNLLKGAAIAAVIGLVGCWGLNKLFHMLEEAGR